MSNRIVAINKDNTIRVVDHEDGRTTVQVYNGKRWTVKEHVGQMLTGRPMVVKTRWANLLKQYNLNPTTT